MKVLLNIRYISSLLLGVLYSNDYGIIGTGLELDRMDDYVVDIILHNTKNLDFDFNEHSLETYVMKNLYQKEFYKDKISSNNKLTVNIEFGSYVGDGGFETRVWLTFHRPGTYVASKVKYKKLFQVWETDTSFIFSNPIHTDFKKNIIKVLDEHLKRFNNSLHRSNQHYIYN